MRLLLVGLAFAAAGCTTKMSHPARTAAQQQADIKLCSDAAIRKYRVDVVSRVAEAFDCLSDKGYRRERTDVSISLEAPTPPPRRAPQRSCRVPCRGT